MPKQKFSIISFNLFLFAVFFNFAAHAAPSKNLITNGVVKEIRSFLASDIVHKSILNQNKKYGNMSEADITALDNQWKTEREATDQPLISAILSNPLSSYLTRIQAHSLGLYPEIFVMDKNGLNVGQSNISSDFWQGDEDKFQKTFGAGAEKVFIDEPEFNNEMKIWSTQINFSISDPSTGELIGAATVEINLTELARRDALKNMTLQN